MEITNEDTNQKKSQFPDDSAERKPAGGREHRPALPACVWQDTANAKPLQFKHLENGMTEKGEPWMYGQLQTGLQQRNAYAGCFKKSFTTLKAYIHLFRGYIQCFELS
jgi:hypothetical protein